MESTTVHARMMLSRFQHLTAWFPKSVLIGNSGQVSPFSQATLQFGTTYSQQSPSPSQKILEGISKASSYSWLLGAVAVDGKIFFFPCMNPDILLKICSFK